MFRQIIVAVNKHGQVWFAGLLIGLTLAIYAPAVRFGLIWDDPRFYQAAAAVSPWWKAFFVPSIGTQQYYRPLAVIYSQWLMTASGVVNSPLAHVTHLGVHLAILLSTFALLRALRFGVAHARLTILCLALFPPGYFAVAWHATQQPVMLLFVILAIIAAQRFTRRRQFGLLLLSLAAYAAALLVMEGAVPFVAAFVWLAWETRQISPPSPRSIAPGARLQAWLSSSGWALLHLALVGIYVLVWLSLPLNRSVTGQGFELPVLAYLLQGMVYPVGQMGAGALDSWSAVWLVGAFTLVWAVLTLGIWKWQSGRVAIWANLWVALGLGPTWAGLSWGYAQYGARLFYPAAVGIAMAWGGWMSLAFRRQKWLRLLGVVMCVTVIGSSLGQVWQFRRLYQTATAYLARAVEVLSAARPSSQPILFVNFPDQLELRPPAYPVGYWGLVLAPVIQNLSDYALASVGHSADDLSLSASSVGTEARANWPYRVDMRGIDTPTTAFFEAAQQASAVYLTDYLPNGTLSLGEAGAIRAAAAGGPYLARFGDNVQLVKAEISPAGELRLVWRCLGAPQTGDTIFVHFWRGEEYVGNADGDSLGGLVPVSTWQAGTEILDVRPIAPALAEPGVYDVRVGLYNRDRGVRYPASAADGEPYSDGEVSIGIYQK